MKRCYNIILKSKIIGKVDGILFIGDDCYTFLDKNNQIVFKILKNVCKIDKNNIILNY